VFQVGVLLTGSRLYSLLQASVFSKLLGFRRLSYRWNRQRKETKTGVLILIWGSRGDTPKLYATRCVFHYKPFEMQGCHPGRGGASAAAAMARIHIHAQHIDAAAGLPG
jgi:hypothetical protein